MNPQEICLKGKLYKAFLISDLGFMELISTKDRSLAFYHSPGRTMLSTPTSWRPTSSPWSREVQELCHFYQMKAIKLQVRKQNLQFLMILGDKMDQLNGVVIPGGDVLLQHGDGSLTDFSIKGKFILDYAKEQNKNGIYYPVWAVCQGFEQLSVIEVPKQHTLVQASSQNIPWNLTFVMPKTETRMFMEMPDDLIEAIETEAISYHNNGWRVDPETFKNEESLKEYNVIAISHDRDGRPMVASIEHQTYPIYSHQFHPEKNQFVWVDTLPIPHTKHAMDLSKQPIFIFRQILLRIFR